MRRVVVLAMLTMVQLARADEAPEEGVATFSPAVDPSAAIDLAIAARKDELGKAAYQFCHDDDFEPQAARGDRRFCKAWDTSSSEACPEAMRSCQDKPESWWSKVHWDLPPWLGWSILAAGLLAALVLFLRALAGDGFRRDPDLDLGAAVDDAMAGQLQALPEAPSMAILKRARRSLDEGRVDEAAVLIQMACLRYFDDNGLAAFHPSKTNGEYLRAVRPHPRHHDLYRRVARETDRARFGGASAEEQAVEACLGDAIIALAAEHGAPRLAPASMLLLGALALSNQGCADDQKPYYSHRPAGHAALPALLRKIGLEVVVSRYRIDEIPPEVGVVLMSSSLVDDLDELSLDALLDRDVRIIVMDDQRIAPRFLPVTTSSATDTVLELPGVDQLLRVGNEMPRAEQIYVHDIEFCSVNLGWIDARLGRDRLRLPVGPALLERSEPETVTTTKTAISGPITVEPLLFADASSGETVARAYGGVRIDPETELPLPGCLLLFASEDLFTNASLAVPQNAQFVAGLFASLGGRGKQVLLLDALKATKSGIARSIADSRLLPFILHGLTWVALLFVFLGAAFGPLRDAVKIEHKAFVEHVEALGRQYARLGDAGMAHVGKSLARYAVMRHRAEARGGWPTLARDLAEKYKLPEEDVRTALRLGSDNALELGPAVSATEARSERVLRVLTVLITGRSRRPKPAKYRR